MSHLIQEAHQRALTVLRDNRNALDAVAAALVKDESLDRGQITAIISAHRPAGAKPDPVPAGPPVPNPDAPQPVASRQ